MFSTITSFNGFLGHVGLARVRPAMLRAIGTKVLHAVILLSLLLPPPHPFSSPLAQPPAGEQAQQSSSAAVPVTLNTSDWASEQPRPHSPVIYLPVSPRSLPDNPEAVQLTNGVYTRSSGNSVGGVMYVANSRQIGRTRNFSSPSPNWISITGAISGTIFDFVVDPFDPYNQAWVVGTTGVWKTTNLDEEVPVWSQIRSMQTISETVPGPHDGFHGVGRILPSPVRPGFYVITVWDGNPLGGNDQGGWIGRTFDAGANWQWSQLQADDTWYGSPNHSELAPHTPLDMADDGSGQIWLGMANDAGQPRIHYSPDWGETWEYIKGISRNWTQPRNMYIPDLNPNVIYMQKFPDSRLAL